MQNKYIIRRYLLFAIALFINAMGIAYITKADLGTSPITSVTYVSSMFTPFSMGQWTIILNLLFVVLEKAPTVVAPKNTASQPTKPERRLTASTATAVPTTNTTPARNGATRTATT